jgi:hypothetical protein
MKSTSTKSSPCFGPGCIRCFRVTRVGTLKGLCIHLDGVRIKETFGDVVNGDLIPTIVIDGFAPIAAPVPEPSQYAMFLAGLGMAGLVARRHMNRI